MINKKEVLIILVAAIVLAALISFVTSLTLFLYSLLAVFLVIIINVIAKKISAYYLESEVEIQTWTVEQWGFNPKRRFKKPVFAGLILPIISKIFLLPFQGFVWMASLVFEVKPKASRAAKRHGLYSFSEMSESHIGRIAAMGIIANLAFMVIGYLIGFDEFARLNLYYALFNMLPLSDLDGNKIFFGSIITWVTLAAVVLIALAGVILIH